MVCDILNINACYRNREQTGCRGAVQHYRPSPGYRRPGHTGNSGGQHHPRTKHPSANLRSQHLRRTSLRGSQYQLHSCDFERKNIFLLLKCILCTFFFLTLFTEKNNHLLTKECNLNFFFIKLYYNEG